MPEKKASPSRKAAMFILNINNIKTTTRLCRLIKGVKPAIMDSAKAELICAGDVSELMTRNSLMSCESMMTSIFPDNSAC